MTGPASQANSISPPLQDLLARCALGDQRAFAALYRNTSAKLFSVSLRILRREDWAEEVLQEAFVNIWNHAADYNISKSAPMTWMTSIVRNRALDWLRRSRFENTEDFETLIETRQDDGAGPLELLMQSSEAHALALCLGQLDGKQRQTIMLAFFHGLTHSELAGHLRQPLGTVKTWVRRGLERLKTCLTTQDGQI